MLGPQDQPEVRELPDPLPVPLVTIPSLPETDCGRLQLDAYLGLSEAELRGLLGKLRTKDQTRHARIRRRLDTPGGMAVFLEERFGIDVLAVSDQKRFAEDLDLAGNEQPPVAFLHLDLELFALADSTKMAARTDEQEVVARFWDWAQENPVHAHVRAWMTYDVGVRRSIINLPLPVPGDISAFDAIPGLWLVKREKPGADEPVLYEVSLRQESDSLTLFVHFRASLDGSADMLSNLLSRAQQIASFAAPEAVVGRQAQS